MSTTMQIIQPKVLRDGFEIRSDEKLIASLLCSGFFRSRAEARIGRKRWHFINVGFFRQAIKVVDRSGSQADTCFVAEVIRTGGSIELDGRLYSFRRTNRFKQHYGWFDDNGSEVLSYEIGGIARLAGQISVADRFADDPYKLLLALVGLYKIKLDADISSAAVG